MLVALRHLTSGTERELAAELVGKVDRLRKSHAEVPNLDEPTALLWVRALAAHGGLTPHGSSPLRGDDSFWLSGGSATEASFRLTLSHITALRDRPPNAAPVVFPLYGRSHRLVPTSLGAVVSYARAHRRTPPDSLELMPLTFCEERLVGRLVQTAGPCVILLSDYVWSVEENTALARAAKAANPDVVVVRGGPQFPKYPNDVERFFHEFGDAVDIGVHGEGEATFCELLDLLANSVVEPQGNKDNTHRPTIVVDKTELRRVAGLCFADGDTVVITDPRDRIDDLATLPSPFRDGTIPLDANGQLVAIIETNRGCPYGCTFCDWGSSTLSRVRFRPEQEVWDDIDYLCERGVREVFIADANFGFTERDVRTAQRLADRRAQTGSPDEVRFSYAKNTHKHLAEILRIFDDAGIVCTRTLSLQTIDATTLRNVKRSNIKVSSYQRLGAEVRNQGWPISTELMVALPGSTKSTVANDLQFCIDRATVPTIARTVVLVNSPMNAPDYRAEFNIAVDDRNRIISCSSFSEAELGEIMDLVHAYRLLEAASVGRYLLRFGQDMLDRRVIDLIDDLHALATAEPQRVPTLATLLSIHAEYMPAWWDYDAAVDEIRDALVSWGVADDSALAAVVAAQKHVLPRPGRAPGPIALDHDVAAWFADRLADQVDTAADQAVPPSRPLHHYPAGVLTTSPRSRTGNAVLAGAIYQVELDSPLALAYPVGTPHYPRRTGD